MNLYELLVLKYPTANFQTDIILQDDGKGAYIKQWNLSGNTQPTIEQLTTWYTDSAVLSAYTFAQNKLSNMPIKTQLDDIDAQSIRALRTNDTARLTTLETQAAALRATLLPEA